MQQNLKIQDFLCRYDLCILLSLLSSACQCVGRGIRLIRATQKSKPEVSTYYILHNSFPPTRSEGGVLGKWHQAESFAFAPFVTPVPFDGNGNGKFQDTYGGVPATGVHMRASTVENNSRDRRIV